MNDSMCQHEAQVAEAAGTERWTPCLTAHVAECAECSDVALVSGLLRATEEPRDPEVDLSHAAGIWWRMETQKRQTAADQALLPVTIGELAACVFGGVALGGFAVAYGSPFAQGLETTGHRLLADPLVIFMGVAAAMLMVGAGFLSIVLALGFGAVKT